MSMGDILGALADKGTLDLTKTDTTAIRNTLGIFPGGGIEDTVVKKLLELEGRIEEIAARQNSYTYDNFIIDCMRHYTVATTTDLTTEEKIIVEVQGKGVLRRIYARYGAHMKVYIDGVEKFNFGAVSNSASANLDFSMVIGGDGNTAALIDLARFVNDTAISASIDVPVFFPVFNKSLKIVGNIVYAGSQTPQLDIMYGIGGAAV